MRYYCVIFSLVFLTCGDEPKNNPECTAGQIKICNCTTVGNGNTICNPQTGNWGPCLPCNANPSDIWNDPKTGKTWQVNSSKTTMQWKDAKQYCENLTLQNYSDWALPTISQLRSLISGCSSTITGGSCNVSDSCLAWENCNSSSCGGCNTYKGPAEGCYWSKKLNGRCRDYWSISRDESKNGFYWKVNFEDAWINRSTFSKYLYVRCIR